MKKIQCLTTEVREQLSLCGANLRAQEYFDTNELIISTKGMDPDSQRMYQNRYWNLQLLGLEENTIDVRFCLITNGTTDDWFRLFKQMVIPCIVRNNLPRKIG